MLQLFLLIPVFHYCDELGGPASSRYYSFLYLDPEFDEEFIFDVFEMIWEHHDSQNVKTVRGIDLEKLWNHDFFKNTDFWLHNPLDNASNLILRLLYRMTVCKQWAAIVTADAAVTWVLISCFL